MTPKLFGLERSPPVRSVLLTAKAIGLDLELVEMSLVDRDHFKPEFLKMNPQHTVPTLLTEDGFIVWESAAICCYLIGKYGKDLALYPKCIETRALIDQRLHFSTGVLATRLKNIAYPVLKKGQKVLTDSQINDIYEAYDFLEIFLENRMYVANEVSVADFAIAPYITSLKEVKNLSVSAVKYQNIVEWLNRLNQIPYFKEINEKGSLAFGELINSKI